MAAEVVTALIVGDAEHAHHAPRPHRCSVAAGERRRASLTRPTAQEKQLVRVLRGPPHPTLPRFEDAVPRQFAEPSRNVVQRSKKHRKSYQAVLISTPMDLQESHARYEDNVADKER